MAILDSNRVTGVSTVVNATDAANKSYADSVFSGGGGSALDRGGRSGSRTRGTTGGVDDGSPPDQGRAQSRPHRCDAARTGFGRRLQRSSGGARL